MCSSGVEIRTRLICALARLPQDNAGTGSKEILRIRSVETYSTLNEYIRLGEIQVGQQEHEINCLGTMLLRIP